MISTFKIINLFFFYIFFLQKIWTQVITLINSSSSKLPSLFLEKGQLLICLMIGSCEGEFWKFNVSAGKYFPPFQIFLNFFRQICSTCPECGISFQLAPLPRLLKIPANKKRDSIKEFLLRENWLEPVQRTSGRRSPPSLPDQSDRNCPCRTSGTPTLDIKTFPQGDN